MIVYTQPRFKPRKKRKTKGIVAQRLNLASLHKERNSPSLSPRFFDDSTRNIQSLSIDTGNTFKKESIKYTGTLVRGIATMHKSNAVPVIDQEQMKEISRMRRG